jgi:hypothetical protein
MSQKTLFHFFKKNSNGEEGKRRKVEEVSTNLVPILDEGLV